MDHCDSEANVGRTRCSSALASYGRRIIVANILRGPDGNWQYGYDRGQMETHSLGEQPGNREGRTKAKGDVSRTRVFSLLFHKPLWRLFNEGRQGVKR